MSASLAGLLASECWKTFTSRSTHWTLGAAAASIALAASMTASAMATWEALEGAQREHFALASLEGLSVWVACLCFAALGVFTVTSEYATGLACATFVATPNRRLVLAAKSAVVGVVGLLGGATVSFGSALASRLVAGAHPMWLQAVYADVASLVAMSLSIAMFALLGLGLGALLRSAPSAIGTVVALWYFLPMIGQDLPAPWDEIIGSLVPGALAGQLAAVEGERSVLGSALPPWAALLAMTMYAFGPLGAALILIRRRDV